MKIKNIFFGVGIIILLLFINTFIAFVIFSPTSEDTKIILGSWFVVDFLILFVLIRVKILNKQTFLFSGLFILFLVVMYFIPVSKNLTLEMEGFNKEISDRYDNRMLYAKNLFLELDKKWEINIRDYLLFPQRVFFIKNPVYFWELEEGSYVDSNAQLRIYYNLLLDSSRFSKEEMIFKHSFCTNSFHPYLIILDDNMKIYVDFFASDNFEKYSFGMYTPYPCRELVGDSF